MLTANGSVKAKRTYGVVGLGPRSVSSGLAASASAALTLAVKIYIFAGNAVSEANFTG